MTGLPWQSLSRQRCLSDVTVECIMLPIHYGVFVAPSTGRATPETNRPAAEAKYRIASEISFGSTHGMRIGDIAAARCRKVSIDGSSASGT